MTDTKPSREQIMQRQIERCKHGHYAYHVDHKYNLYGYLPCRECLQEAYEHLMERCIELWHDTEGTGTIADALGVDASEYAKWLERGCGYVVML